MAFRPLRLSSAFLVFVYMRRGVRAAAGGSSSQVARRQLRSLALGKGAPPELPRRKLRENRGGRLSILAPQSPQPRGKEGEWPLLRRSSRRPADAVRSRRNAQKDKRARPSGPRARPRSRTGRAARDLPASQPPPAASRRRFSLRSIPRPSSPVFSVSASFLLASQYVASINGQEGPSFPE